MKEVIFEIRGVTELQLQIPTGIERIPSVRIEFTGGQISGYGVTPARFVTKDPFIQRLIGKHPLYLKKRITSIPDLSTVLNPGVSAQSNKKK